MWSRYTFRALRWLLKTGSPGILFLVSGVTKEVGLHGCHHIQPKGQDP